MTLIALFFWHLEAIAALMATVACDIAGDSFHNSCLTFTPAKLIRHSSLTHQEFVSAGSILNLSDGALMDVSGTFCRSSKRGIKLTIHTGIKYKDLGYSRSYSFTTIGTNNSYNSTAGILKLEQLYI
jgi:hypothetical protein